ncbi:alpha/beta hydrolase [Natronogracilivirga saccharolytica]|uniref:Alpha/beta hydrolase n=1 Tax=Natronogracilivirga saccharolytica TaxID=2812953 RepID=A0A8J7UXL6_9BACT|nr:alpha/beta hydrolase [Natronogracilivirga saccharolytica]MBP3193464.1 alpha/beta hydrolase [Natronogracilivirga saccharolytica]
MSDFQSIQSGLMRLPDGGLRKVLLTLTALLLLFVFWLFRPNDSLPVMADTPGLPELTFGVDEAQEAVRARELDAGPLKPDNHARIVWNSDYRDQRAPCSIVYIHGFSASYGEGAPLHERLARDHGCHLYVSRLHGHGLRTDEPLKRMEPDSLVADAARALAIGDLLGDEVIVMGTSMGGTLALHLASEFTDVVDRLILLAPLIEFDTAASVLFDRTWGQRLMRLVLRGSYLDVTQDNDDHSRYWYGRYHIRALGALKKMAEDLLEEEEESVFERVRQPVFVGYFYKDDDEKDEVVSVDAIRGIKDKLGTPSGQKVFVAFPDAGAHVIGSSYRSAEHDQVRQKLLRFLEKDFD